MADQSGSTTRHGHAPPWEAYQRALYQAKTARARLLCGALAAAAQALRDRICRRAEKRGLRWCPLCC